MRRCGLRRVKRQSNSTKTAEAKASVLHGGFQQPQFTSRCLKNLSGDLRFLAPALPRCHLERHPHVLGQRPPLSPSALSRPCFSATSTTISPTPFSGIAPVGPSGLLLRLASSTACDTLLSALSTGPSLVDDGGLLPGTAACISSMTVALAISSAHSDSSVVTVAEICGRDPRSTKAHESHQKRKRATTMDEINATIGYFRSGTALTTFLHEVTPPMDSNSTAPKIILYQLM